MLHYTFLKELLSFLLTLLPAAFVWWQGRALLRRIDDPAFPEMRFARGQRTAIVAGVCIAVSLVLSLEHAALKLALAVLGVL